MTTENPTVLLAYARARGRYADAVYARASAKLGVGGDVETAARRGRGRPLTELTAEELERDTRSLRNITKAWTRKRFRRAVGTSTISLPSGRELVYDWTREEVVR